MGFSDQIFVVTIIDTISMRFVRRNAQGY